MHIYIDIDIMCKSQAHVWYLLFCLAVHFCCCIGKEMRTKSVQGYEKIVKTSCTLENTS